MIIFTHHTGEPHGILGAQVSATFFQRRLSIPSIVVGIARDFSKERRLRFIGEYYEGKEKKSCFHRSALNHSAIDCSGISAKGSP